MNLSKIVNRVVLLSLFVFAGCETLNEASKVAWDIYSNTETKPTSAETVLGLKEALSNGVLSSVDVLGKDNGFFLSKMVKIPFPEEIKAVDNSLRKIGLGSVSDAFIKELNKGAEKAVIKASPIFRSAIKSMSFEDAMGILLGNKNAATSYFDNKTRNLLYSLFKPEVKKSLDQYGISNSFTSLMQQYNTIPFVKPVTTDINDYVTTMTIDGLFKMIAKEEEKVRTDISYRKGALLKKVFGYADKNNSYQN